MIVTREMINAGHNVTMKQGVILSHEILAAIYEAMHAARKSRITWACPVCCASVQFGTAVQPTTGPVYVGGTKDGT